MKIIKLDINKIKPYKNNAKIHTKEQIEQIKKSILEFGMNDPIAIWGKENIIIEGHGRVEALKQLGYTEIECIRLDHLTDEERKAYTLAHNKLTMNTDFDFNILDEELANINIDMSDFGFDICNTNEDIKEIQEDNYNLDKKVESKVKKGEIWQLGKNKLMCGDSFLEEDIKKIMKEEKADFTFCDPSYDLEDDSWISNLKFTKEGAPILLMASDKQTVRLANKIPNFRHFIIHDRVSAVMLNSNMPMSRHTIISLFCEHPSKYFVNLKDYFTTIIEANKNYKDSKEENYSKMGKPVTLIAKLIEHYSKKEDLVMDLFGGGGSTIIACEQLNRRCYLNEIKEEQCDLIIDRWENFTKQKAIKLN
nr:MAG TPA: adenine specific DNA methyltransferase [Caudoviricetes sp.]